MFVFKMLFSLKNVKIELNATQTIEKVLPVEFTQLGYVSDEHAKYMKQVNYNP